MADLKRKSIRGGTVTIVSQAVTIAIQLTSTVILARLLSPDDYGVMAMVFAVTGFAGLFRDLGLSSAAIQKKDLTDAQQSNLFWLNVAMGSILTLLVAAGSPLVAWFYGKPELTHVTAALSASFLIGSFGTQHGARLVREMQFTRQAAANIGGALVGLAVSVTLALRGYSYWSLVLGNLAGGLITTLLLFAVSPFRPGLPSKNSGVRDMLKFGANVTAFDFVNYFHRNLDNILIGRFWGAIQLGYYSRAYSLLMMPISAIRGPINAVGFPALCRLQSQPVEYCKFGRNITSIIAFLSMPIAGFLGVSSKPLIEVVLGSGWGQSSIIFTSLAIVAFLQPVSSIRGQVMLSCGNVERYLKWGCANAFFISVSFLIGVRWGAHGVAISYAISNSIILLPSVWYAFSGTPMQMKDFLYPITRPLVVSLASVIALIAFDLIPGNKINDASLESLLLRGLVYCAIYLAGNCATLEGRRQLIGLKSILSS